MVVFTEAGVSITSRSGQALALFSVNPVQLTRSTSIPRQKQAGFPVLHSPPRHKGEMSPHADARGPDPDALRARGV